MENIRELSWSEKMEILKSELEKLHEHTQEVESNSMKMVGLEVEELKKWFQKPIREYFERAKIKHLKVIEVPTSGAPLLILSSQLYPEVGLLVFDGPGNNANYPVEIQASRVLRTVCTCCSPERVGQPYRGINANFVKSVINTCENNGIKHLLLQYGSSGYGIQDEFNSQNDIQIHLLDEGRRSMEGIDPWRFAAAFVEISKIGKEERPFLGLFNKE